MGRVKEYRVSEEYLNTVISNGSKTLVGQIMKRFDNSDNVEEIKKEVRELVYENYRTIKAYIQAFQAGLEFETPKKQD